MSITIPPAALEAGARSLCPDGEPSLFCREQFRDACLAMLAAWPKSLWDYAREDGKRLILPLPQEKA